MDITKLKIAAVKLFRFFEETNPQAYNGQYLSAKTNLILAFDEFINNMNIQNIQEITGLLNIKINKREAEYLRKIMNREIEKYLTDNIKIIALP